MKGAPCKNCDRKGCGAYHDQCEKFLEYKREKEKLREWKRKEGMRLCVKVGEP